MFTLETAPPSCGKMRKGKRRTDKVVGGEMSLTEVGRLAIDKNCFRWAVKDATSYEISS